MTWLIRKKDGTIQGPLTTEEVIRKIRAGSFFGEEQISRYPSGDWIPITYQEQFFEELLEVLEDEMNDDGRRSAPLLPPESQLPPMPETDSKQEEPPEIFPPRTPEPDGQAVAFDDEKTPDLIDVPAKKRSSRGKAVEDFEIKKQEKVRQDKESRQKDRRRRQRKKQEQQYFSMREQRSRSRRKKIVLVVAVLAVVYFFLQDTKIVPLEGNRIRLRRPKDNVKEKLDRKTAKILTRKALTSFRKDTVQEYIKAQDSYVELVEKTNNLDSYAFLCMIYKELWPRSYQDSKDINTILKVLREVQNINPKSDSASVCLVVYQWVNGRYEDALRIMENHLRVKPSFLFFNQMTGDIYASRQEYAMATYYFSKVRELWRPPPVWARSLLQEARMKRKLGKYGQSIKLYRKILRSNRKHAVAQVELGILEFQAFQHLNKAQDHIRTGLRDEWVPSQTKAEAYLVLAQMARIRGQRQQALQHAKRSFSLDSSNDAARKLIVNLGGIKALNSVTIDNENMVTIGEQYMKMGNYAAAQAEFRAAYEANNKNAFAALRAGQALWKLNQSNEAIAWVQRSITADPKFVRSYVILSNYMSQRYDYVNAITALKQALRVNPKHHDIFRGMAVVELRRRNFKGAAHFAEKALDLYDTDIEAILVLATAHYKMDEHETAYQYVVKASELDSSNENVQSMYAKILVSLQGPQAGIDFISNQIVQTPNNLNYRRTLGEILVNEEKDSEAIDVFNEILAINPQDKKTLINLGKILQKRKQWDGAREYLLEAASLDPSDAEPVFLTGQLYYESGRPTHALKQFERVVDVNRKYPMAHYYAGKAMIDMQDYEEALLMAKEEKKLNPSIPEPYLLAGEAHMMMKQYSLCTEEYQLAIQKGYAVADAYIKLAKCQRLSGALDAALSMLSEAERRESGNPEIYKELGALYQMQSAYEKAIAAYNRYLQLNPQAPDSGQVKGIINQLRNQGGE